MADPIRVAVVGYGYWSPKLIRNSEALPTLSLAAICEKDTTRHEAIRTEHPGVEVYQHYRDAFADTAIEAVVIATIPSSHYRIAKMALEAGKHVLVEKPLTLALEDAQILVELAREKGLTLMVDHTYLYTPAIQKLRELVRDGTLGTLYAAQSVRINLGLFQRDTNVLWDLAPHDFSILLSLMSERPKAVSAVGTKTVVHPQQERSQESDAHITLHYPSGFSAHIHVSWISPTKVRQLTVIGSERMALYDQLAEHPLVLYDQGVYPAEGGGESGPRFTYKVGPTTPIEVPQGTEDLRAMLSDFAGAIEEHRTPVASAELGLEVVAILVAADASMKRGGAPTDISYDGGNPFVKALRRARPR